MKYLLSLLLLFSVASAQNLAQNYASLTPEKHQQYDLVAQRLKPKLAPLGNSVQALALNTGLSALVRLEKLSTVQARLNTWVGSSALKYTIMLPLLNTLQAQREVLAKQLPLRIPYKNTQIKAQFDISGAQAYALGSGNVALVRGQTQRGAFARNDKVMVYFKQGGPVLTSIREIVSSPGDTTEVFLLANDIAAERFLGGAVLLIPQR